LSAFGGGWAAILIFVGLFVFGYIIARNESPEIKTYKQTKILMGTVVEIQVRDTDEEKAKQAISNAFNEIKRIDDLFSSYNEESIVWKLNHGVTKAQNLSSELFDIIAFSDSLWKISGGAFDVSLGNLIDLWGFNSERKSVPGDENIEQKLASSGWKNVQMKNDNSIFILNQAKLDFGAVAKGYAVDKAIEVQKLNKVSSALVNAGGEVKSFGGNWVVGIQHPRNKNEIIGKIKLSGMSVATSGDYEQYFEANGKRYHHILNPKTGMPAYGCQSVTVISQENKIADAFATAVFVLGPEKGMELVNKFEDIEALIIDSNGRTLYSKDFEKFLLR
jgi:thiamine biosynthesis lipoprotein ApbE